MASLGVMAKSKSLPMLGIKCW